MSNRKMIDFGIDLGTTNSAIAMSDASGTTIIRTLDGETTPSAVYIGGKGGKSVEIGQAAKRKHFGSPLNVALEFKQKIHLPAWRHRFPSTDVESSAIDLSANVLRELLDAVRRSSGGESISAAVISVPEAFKNPHHAATKEAGIRAGLTYVELVKEPVAAALAFGEHLKPSGRVIWLVFDLGGGTFDATLMRYEDGVPTTIATVGNPYLGGKNLDAAIVERHFKPRLTEERQKTLIPFDSACRDWWILKSFSERAKISLATKERFWLDEGDFDCEFDFFPDQLAELEREVFGPAVEMCKQLLSDSGYQTNDLDRVLLVGGSTYSPGLREMLKSELGVPLESSVDALTAVARGAAIYASRIRIPERSDSPAPSPSGYHVKWTSDLVCSSDALLLTGLVSGDKSPPWSTWLLRLKQMDASGNVIRDVENFSPDERGAFAVSVGLGPGENAFVLEARDASGEVQALTGATVTVRCQAEVPQVSVPHGIGWVDAHDEIQWLATQHDPLPITHKKSTVKTTKEIRRGTHDQMILVLVEGNDPKPDLNTVIGELVITGEEVEVTIPPKTEVELTFSMDRSHGIELIADCDDFDVSAKVKYGGKDRVHLQADLQRVAEDCRVISSAVRVDDSIASAVGDQSLDSSVNDIKSLLSLVSESNPEPGEQAQGRLLDLKRRIDPWVAPAYEAMNWFKWKAYCDQNFLTGMAIVESHQEDVSTAEAEEFKELVARYEAALQSRNRTASEEIAYGQLVQFFRRSPALVSFVQNTGDATRPDIIQPKPAFPDEGRPEVG